MLKVSFTDFWDGFKSNNNLITNILNDILETKVQITNPRNADICFVTIFGKTIKE